MPQARFWIAMASENSDRGQPNSAAIGIWNTPKLARTAKPSMMMMHPPISTGVKRGARAVIIVSGLSRATLRRAARPVKSRIVIGTIKAGVACAPARATGFPFAAGHAIARTWPRR
jgi:hypothetical protein